MRDVADTGRRAGRERPWWRAPAASPVSDREKYRAHVLAAMPVELAAMLTAASGAR
jgi:hypothetical protein